MPEPMDVEREQDIRTADRIYGGEFSTVGFLLRLLDADRARADAAEARVQVAYQDGYEKGLDANL